MVATKYLMLALVAVEVVRKKIHDGWYNLAWTAVDSVVRDENRQK